MTHEEMKLIRQTWRSLKGVDECLLGEVFYSRLFLDEPSLQKILKLSKEQQSKKLIDMLDLIVRRLDRLDEISEEIKVIANHHESNSLKPRHYDQMGKTLLWTLEKGLGKDWKPEVATAWAKCYGILSDSLLQNK